jgi:hypothetical protein
VSIGAVVLGVSSVRLALVTGVNAAVGSDVLTLAVVFKAFGALRTVWLHARARLRSNTDTVTLFDVLDILANFDGFADNLVTDNASYSTLAY